MKKLIFLTIPVVAGMLMLASCNKAATTSAAKSDTVTMPYKATYSSSFSIPDSQKLVLLVLQSYKDWENNKLSNAAAYFADTLGATFSDGMKFRVKRDSAVKIFQRDRDSLSSSKIEMAGWTAMHSNDKNEDWVLTWYKQTDTHKDGKVDSNFYHDLNHIKNGKIDFFTSLKQVLKPAKKM